MAKFTLLQMTQNILSRMSSDEVNSISDTTESMQIANIIQNKFYDLVARGTLPEFKKLIQLDPSVDSTRPTLMYVPNQISKIYWIKYFDSNPSDSQQEDQFGSFDHDLNTDLVDTDDSGLGEIAAGYKYVKSLTIEDFLTMVNGFNPGDDNVLSFEFDEGGHNFLTYYKNDHQPKYFCIISDKYILFDSFDNTQDTTLQSSKTMCLGEQVPTFVLSDSYIPPLDDLEFPLLMNEAAALAFFELKQMPHQKAEQEIKRGWSYIQKKRSTINKPTFFEQLPNFGRIPRTGGYASGDGAYRWMRET